MPANARPQTLRARIAALTQTLMHHYWQMSLVVVVVFAIGARHTLAADGYNRTFAEEAQLFLAGLLVQTFVMFLSQRSWRKARHENKVNEKALADLKQKVPQDLEDLKTGLKMELLEAMQERDAAREKLAEEIHKRGADAVKAQAEIDRLHHEVEGGKETIEAQNQVIKSYEERFRAFEMEQQRIIGRLDQQERIDQWSVMIRGLGDLIQQLSIHLPQAIASAQAAPASPPTPAPPPPAAEAVPS